VITVLTDTEVRLTDLPATVAAILARGSRFAGLFASPRGSDVRLRSVLVRGKLVELVDAIVPDGCSRYPALTPAVPPAAWYEREINDLFGLLPAGHPRTDPLVLPLVAGSPPPRPGSPVRAARAELDLSALPAHLTGEGVFTIPYGPVRSGVFEAIEYLVETPGENIPHLRSRIYYKHRGVERRFENLVPADGVLVAERVEGVASVAHALAFCQAVETIAGTDVSRQASLVRVLHAELERVANHLDSTIRHTEAAGQAVALARLTVHKERVQRLRSRLCGHRFGRGVVVPGGTSGPPLVSAREALRQVGTLEPAIRSDIHLLYETPSFIDRLRGTGVISPEVARVHAAIGPVGKGSGQLDDARIDRPYSAYERLGVESPRPRDEGDALARQRVRSEEMWSAFHLVRESLDELNDLGLPHRWSVPCEAESGEAVSWCEAPQGEVLYLVEMAEGRLRRVKPRSASFHNLALFPLAFPKDIFTDFAFIEASFGISVAGASG
jgi:formate hydrogenlyase subunit 5